MRSVGWPRFRHRFELEGPVYRQSENTFTMLGLRANKLAFICNHNPRVGGRVPHLLAIKQHDVSTFGFPLISHPVFCIFFRVLVGQSRRWPGEKILRNPNKRHHLSFHPTIIQIAQHIANGVLMMFWIAILALTAAFTVFTVGQYSVWLTVLSWSLKLIILAFFLLGIGFFISVFLKRRSEGKPIRIWKAD